MNVICPFGKFRRVRLHSKFFTRFKKKKNPVKMYLVILVNCDCTACRMVALKSDCHITHRKDSVDQLNNPHVQG